MRTRSSLELIKNFIDSNYDNMFGNFLKIHETKLTTSNMEFGYCYKSTFGKEHTVNYYNIFQSKIGVPRTDFRILMHEYGHIYLGHLDGVHELLDSQICDVLDNNRFQLIEGINKECGIDFADKLLERVIDDPELNHSLHNIAMDMEVNSTILSEDDVKEMQEDMTNVLMDLNSEKIKAIKEYTTAIGWPEEKVKEFVDLIIKSFKIKLMIPSKYHLSDGSPFPDELTYPEYLILIIKNISQFVKMLVNIQKGGDGDTSGVTSEEVKDLLSQMANKPSSGDGSNSSGGNGAGSGSGSGSGNGSSPSMESLDNLLKSTGLINPYKGERPDDGGGGDKKGDKDGGGCSKDHSSPNRDSADEKRAAKEIHSIGGSGCGSSGGADGFRIVSKDGDLVDTAIDEVIKDHKAKVMKVTRTRDVLWKYNRGINRSVISPTERQKINYSTDPKLVFLIDISGSMNTRLIDRILKTIANKLSHLGTGRGLKYDIISWNIRLGEHIKDINPRNPITTIAYGGGTRIAKGIEYFKQNYTPKASLIIISDFEDYLDEWAKVESTMKEYCMYGFNYGPPSYGENTKFKYLKVRNFRK